MGRGGGGGFNKQRRGRPQKNYRQNEHTRSIGNKLGLDDKDRRELHEIVQRENRGYKDIENFAKEWFKK